AIDWRTAAKWPSRSWSSSTGTGLPFAGRTCAASIRRERRFSRGSQRERKAEEFRSRWGDRTSNPVREPCTSATIARTQKNRPPPEPRARNASPRQARRHPRAASVHAEAGSAEAVGLAAWRGLLLERHPGPISWSSGRRLSRERR